MYYTWVYEIELELKNIIDILYDFIYVFFFFVSFRIVKRVL